MFELNETLKNDTIFIADLALSRLLLMNNSLYPSLILVPRKEDISEVIDLEKSERFVLIEEINLISKIVKDIFKPDKLNIAALGNIVPQLHIHIIARYKNDRVFPKTIWVDNEKRNYEKSEAEEIIKKILNLL